MNCRSMLDLRALKSCMNITTIMEHIKTVKHYVPPPSTAPQKTAVASISPH
jgi:hypothetical protein